MNHVAEGVLRRHLDEPGAMSTIDRDHLAGCPRCAAQLSRAEDDRDVIAATLGSGPADLLLPEGKLESAWADLRERLAGPDDAVADGAVPDQTVPDQTVPDQTVPDQTVPDQTVPDQTVPDQTVPDQTVPDQTVPDQTVPDQTVPDQTVPDQTVPDQTVPDQTVPDQTVPDEAVPDEAVPDEARPQRRRPRRWGDRVIRHPVAAAVTAGAVVLGGAAAAAAGDWLPIFKTEKVTPVAVSTHDVAALDQLSRLTALEAYGQVSAPSGSGLSDVPDAATAASRAGLPVPTVGDLPTGVDGAPSYHVLTRQIVEFTFSAAKAATAAKAAGTALPPMPAGLDGSRLRVEAGPGILLTWGQHSGLPSLAVARVKAPTASSQGAPLPVVRDYLLSLPGIPADLASQLKAVTGDGTTLPIPVPADQATSSRATVGGAEATVVELKDRTAAGVVWATGGDIDAVAGPLGRDEVLAVARGLR